MWDMPVGSTEIQLPFEVVNHPHLSKFPGVHVSNIHIEPFRITQREIYTDLWNYIKRKPRAIITMINVIIQDYSKENYKLIDCITANPVLLNALNHRIGEVIHDFICHGIIRNKCSIKLDYCQKDFQLFLKIVSIKKG